MVQVCPDLMAEPVLVHLHPQIAFNIASHLADSTTSWLIVQEQTITPVIEKEQIAPHMASWFTGILLLLKRSNMHSTWHPVWLIEQQHQECGDLGFPQAAIVRAS